MILNTRNILQKILKKGIIVTRKNLKRKETV